MMEIKKLRKLKKFCDNLSKKFKINILYFDINFRINIFSKYSSIYKLFPYNDAIRKLLGSIFILNDLPDKLFLLMMTIMIKIEFLKILILLGKI